jgi:endogenous inhibitor of DNA gyrase (YacG/DUF329 family)
MKVKCPACGRITVYEISNPARPFCSERCQLIDLGAWADEKYKVPVSGQEMSPVNENSQRNSGEDEFSPEKHRLN